MKSFRSENRSGGGSRGPKGRSFGSGGGGGADRSNMYPATCSTCGMSCEVPFRPTGTKPVLCRSCFNKDGGGPSSDSDRRFSSRPSFDRDRNDRSDSFKPRERDVRPADAQPSLELEKMKKQLDRIEAKLTELLEVLTEEDFDGEDEGDNEE